MQPLYLLGIVDRSTGHVYRYCCFRQFLLRQFVPRENGLLQRVIGNGAIRPLLCRRLRRVHIDFVIHGKMDLSETERLRRVSSPVSSLAPLKYFFNRAIALATTAASWLRVGCKYSSD